MKTVFHFGERLAPFFLRFSLALILLWIGALKFIWFVQNNAFVLIAGIVNSDSSAVGTLLHYLIAVSIGASFGLLFQRDVRSAGSGICWGLAYGLFW